jgi:hypothetical protein
MTEPSELPVNPEMTPNEAEQVIQEYKEDYYLTDPQYLEYPEDLSE